MLGPVSVGLTVVMSMLILSFVASAETVRHHRHRTEVKPTAGGMQTSGDMR